MTLFDLLFLVLLLVAVGVFFTALAFALRRQFARARSMLSGLVLCAAVYMLIVIVTSSFLPRRTVKLGEAQCFDDWCVAVSGAQKALEADHVRYTVNFALSSRARGVPQRERYVVLYLIDTRGRRYDPIPNPADVPFDVLLQPQESVVASRSFLLPAEATHVSAVVAHEGGFPIEWLIIGYDAWFHKPPLIDLS